MRALDAFAAALGAIRAHALRSVLTMLGIVIGVAAVIAMVSIGSGASRKVNDQIRSLGANLIQIVPGNVTITGVRLGVGNASTLTDEDAAAVLAEVPTVEAAAPMVRGSAQVVAGAGNWSTALNGVDLDFFVAREWDVADGRLFNPTEARRGGQVAILGQSVVRQLFPDGSPLGATIRVRNVPFEVIGVLAPKGQTMFGTDQDDVLILPLPTARQRVLGINRARGRSVHQIMIKVREGESLVAAENDIRQLLRQRHRLRDGVEDDFSIRNLAEISATREASARTLALLLMAVAGVSLIVGGIGIMNIMLVSVTERTREIGVRMAVGARPRDVMSQFLIEATSLAVIGGVLGIALGLAGALMAAQFAGWPLVVDPLVVVAAVIFSGLVGIASGLYPAFRASRLDPVEALRSG